MQVHKIVVHRNRQKRERERGQIKREIEREREKERESKILGGRESVKRRIKERLDASKRKVLYNLII